jgi:hypothetical protein
MIRLDGRDPALPSAFDNRRQRARPREPRPAVKVQPMSDSDIAFYVIALGIVGLLVCAGFAIARARRSLVARGSDAKSLGTVDHDGVAMRLIEGWINPLKCPEIDLFPRAPDAPPGPPEADRLLDYLYDPEVDRSREAFVARYNEIAAIADPLPIVPAERTILGKLVWPLRHAKGSYALGNYLACIALCGMVGEMVAILLWDISKAQLHGQPVTEANQRALLGSTFEKLGQERRVAVLHALRLVDDATKTAFDDLREIRRRYLHFLSQPHAQLSADARRAYERALKVVAVVLGPTFHEGKVSLRPDLMDYLIEKGIVQPEVEGGAGKADKAPPARGPAV